MQPRGPIIGTLFLPNNSVLIREVSFGEREHQRHSQYLLPRIGVLSTDGHVSCLENVFKKKDYDVVHSFSLVGSQILNCVIATCTEFTVWAWDIGFMLCVCVCSDYKSLGENHKILPC